MAAFREEIRAHVALLCHQRPLGTVCLQQDQITCASGLGYHLDLHHDTAKHSHSGVVKESTGEWNGVLLFSVMRVCSVCMRLMDVHM